MSKPVRTIQIPVSVELGNPAADCAHFGICSVAVLSPKQWAVFKPRHIRHVKAMLSAPASGGLRFEFPLESMRADTRAQFFPMEGFRVDGATVLPRALLQLLRTPPRTGTIPGLYAVSQLADALVVELALGVSGQALATAA